MVAGFALGIVVKRLLRLSMADARPGSITRRSIRFTTQNVEKLKVAWTFHTGDEGARRPASSLMLSSDAGTEAFVRLVEGYCAFRNRQEVQRLVLMPL